MSLFGLQYHSLQSVLTKKNIAEKDCLASNKQALMFHVISLSLQSANLG